MMWSTDKSKLVHLRWYWVTDGEEVWPAYFVDNAQWTAAGGRPVANGWKNDETWEDWDISVIAWLEIGDTPEVPVL